VSWIPRSFNAAALVERQMKRSQKLDEYARRPPIVGRHRANVSISKWLRRGSFGHYETLGEVVTVGTCASFWRAQAVKDPAGDLARDLANLIARGIKRQNKLSSAERPALPAYFKDQMSEAR
jgi:hypothetical protein